MYAISPLDVQNNTDEPASINVLLQSDRQRTAFV
jgi:hypothetical protein